MYSTLEKCVLFWSCRLISFHVGSFFWQCLPNAGYHESNDKAPVHLKGDKGFSSGKMYHLSCNSALCWQMVLRYIQELGTSFFDSEGMSASSIYFVFSFWFVPKFVLLQNEILLLCFQLRLSKQVGQFYFCLFGLAQSWQAELGSKSKSFHWKKSYSWHHSLQCRIFLCLQNLPFGRVLVLQPPFNSSLE